ncbi:hypothetical protein ACSFA0_25410 [Variovorax sp. LT1P1]|uniref:hypothetical protein n=1 Tax=Variovorax sp. LT1P1 TaxID=3443730 RepID=UPI003F48AFA4
MMDVLSIFANDLRATPYFVECASAGIEREPGRGAYQRSFSDVFAQVLAPPADVDRSKATQWTADQAGFFAVGEDVFTRSPKAHAQFMTAAASCVVDSRVLSLVDTSDLQALQSYLSQAAEAGNTVALLELAKRAKGPALDAWARGLFPGFPGNDRRALYGLSEATRRDSEAAARLCDMASLLTEPDIQALVRLSVLAQYLDSSEPGPPWREERVLDICGVQDRAALVAFISDITTRRMIRGQEGWRIARDVTTPTDPLPAVLTNALGSHCHLVLEGMEEALRRMCGCYNAFEPAMKWAPREMGRFKRTVELLGELGYPLDARALHGIATEAPSGLVQLAKTSPASHRDAMLVQLLELGADPEATADGSRRPCTYIEGKDGKASWRAVTASFAARSKAATLFANLDQASLATRTNAP